jgi:hypothetical protein
VSDRIIFFKKQPPVFERLFPGEKSWEPCTIRAMRKSVGRDGDAIIERDGKAVSARGVIYRRKK